jgi:hypothetical protein
MGLDVSAASHLRYVGPIPREDQREQLEKDVAALGKEMWDVYFFVYSNGAPHKARLTGTKPGLYALTERTEQHSFRAGSYSGYNLWRRLLCRFAHGVEPEEVWQNPRRYKGKLFVELIDFTDCDGRIGAKVSAKLAQDFRDHAKRAKDYATTIEDGGYLWEVYQEFTKAFALAGEDGALAFH